MSLTNHYQVLGVSENATHKQIRTAYKKLALKFHPDRNSSAGAEEKFKAINEAHEVLSDAEKRAEHDRSLAQERNPKPQPQQANANVYETRRQSTPTPTPVNPFASYTAPNTSNRTRSASYSTPRPKYQPKPSSAPAASQTSSRPAEPKQTQQTQGNNNVRQTAGRQGFFTVNAQPQSERVSRSEASQDVATFILLMHVERMLQQLILQLLLILKAALRIQNEAHHTSSPVQSSKAPVEEYEAPRIGIRIR